MLLRALEDVFTEWCASREPTPTSRQVRLVIKYFGPPARDIGVNGLLETLHEMSMRVDEESGEEIWDGQGYEWLDIIEGCVHLAGINVDALLREGSCDEWPELVGTFERSADERAVSLYSYRDSEISDISAQSSLEYTALLADNGSKWT